MISLSVQSIFLIFQTAKTSQHFRSIILIKSYCRAHLKWARTALLYAIYTNVGWGWVGEVGVVVVVVVGGGYRILMPVWYTK